MWKEAQFYIFGDFPLPSISYFKYIVVWRRKGVGTWGLLKGEPLPSLCSASAAPPGKCRWKKFFFLRSLCGLCGLWGLLEIFIRVFESARGRGGVKLPEVLLIPENRGKITFFPADQNCPLLSWERRFPRAWAAAAHPGKRTNPQLDFQIPRN